MKILLLADGACVHTVRFQRELKCLGIDVLLASLEKGDTVDIVLKRISGLRPLDYLLSSRQIRNLVEEYSPDIINPHFVCGYGFSTAVAGVWKKIPVVLHCLGSDILISPHKSILHKKRVVYALEKSAHIFVDSKYLCDETRRLYPGSKISIIPWGPDAETFSKFEKRKETNFRSKYPLRVIVLRPHNPVYNNPYIISSLKELINSHRIAITFPDWGDNFVQFKNIVERECPDGLIDYYRFLKRGMYIDFISKYDIYLSASRSDSSPASLIEAMAVGLFPVVADIPGVRELMNDNSGYMFGFNDGGTLRGAFHKLIDTKDNINNLLRKNNKKARELGTFTENIKATLRIMRELTDHVG